jgi:hypothetical protein
VFAYNAIHAPAGITVQQISSINVDVRPEDAKEGQTILLPSGSLSVRDKEILDGIGSVYRVYPVRKGEVLGDIITKRNISVDEMQSLNPGVHLDKLKGMWYKMVNRIVPRSWGQRGPLWQWPWCWWFGQTYRHQQFRWRPGPSLAVQPMQLVFMKRLLRVVRGTVSWPEALP